MPAAVAATAAVPSVTTAAAEAGDDKQQQQGDEAAAESPMMRGVMFYALESQQESLVWQVQPTHVILYDPDIPFIRQLEVSILECGCFCRLASAALQPVQGLQSGQGSAASHILSAIPSALVRPTCMWQVSATLQTLCHPTMLPAC